MFECFEWTPIQLSLQILAKINDKLKPLADGAERNKSRWHEIAESGKTTAKSWHQSIYYYNYLFRLINNCKIWNKESPSRELGEERRNEQGRKKQFFKILHREIISLWSWIWTDTIAELLLKIYFMKIIVFERVFIYYFYSVSQIF